MYVWNMGSAPACLESQCASQLNAANTECGTYLSCVCGEGADARACSGGPSLVEQDGGGGTVLTPCGQDINLVGSCFAANCEAADAG
jgi:hypothetical protein